MHVVNGFLYFLQTTPSDDESSPLLSELQEEATYEVVDQPRPPPPADYQLSACAAYAFTDFNTENQ